MSKLFSADQWRVKGRLGVCALMELQGSMEPLGDGTALVAGPLCMYGNFDCYHDIRWKRIRARGLGVSSLVKLCMDV